MAASTAIMSHSNVAAAGHLVGVVGSNAGNVANDALNSSSSENRSNAATSSSSSSSASSSSEEEDEPTTVVAESPNKAVDNEIDKEISTKKDFAEDAQQSSSEKSDDATSTVASDASSAKINNNDICNNSPHQSPCRSNKDDDDNSTIVGDDDDGDDSQQSIEIDDIVDNGTSEKVSSSSSSPKTQFQPQRDSKATDCKSTTTSNSTKETVNNQGDNELQQQQPHAELESLSLNFGLPISGHSSTTTTTTTMKKKQSTGKLAAITERLAKKQSTNGQTLSNLLDSVASLREVAGSSPLQVNAYTAAAVAAADDISLSGGASSVAPPETAGSATTISEGEVDDDDGTTNTAEMMMMNGHDEDDDDDEDDEEGMILDDGDIDDDDMDDEEEDEEIKNGFRALGLMGNVAFIGDEKFKCPVCGIKLDSQHTFTLHIRSHNPNDHSNTCRLCGKTLSSASSLDRHMLIHSGERPFKCSICNMAFTTNGNMHRHMRTHGHGTIGYTPRGAKRRAKLFAQQAAKVAAAAAAGEPVDAATISKLKKSALEVTTGNGKSPISGTPMKKQRGGGGSGGGRRSGGGGSGGDPFDAMSGDSDLNAALASNPAATLLEAERIAAAAAAYAAAVATSDSSSKSSGHKTKSSSSNSHHHHHHPHHHSHNQQTFGSFASPASSRSASQQQSGQQPTQQQQQLAAAAMNLGMAGWPADLSALSAAVQQAQQQQPVMMPQKGKPGRKKKIRDPPPPPPPPPPPKHSLPTQSAPQPPAIGTLESSSASSLAAALGQFPADTFSSLTASPCPICGFATRTKIDLHVHMTSFHSGEKLFCLDCGMILDNYNIYVQHHCTVTAGAVMSALTANPAANADLLFQSTNTSRMNFSSARMPLATSHSQSSSSSSVVPGTGSGPFVSLASAGSTQATTSSVKQQPTTAQDHLQTLLSQLNKSFGAVGAAMPQSVSTSPSSSHFGKDPFSLGGSQQSPQLNHYHHRNRSTTAMNNNNHHSKGPIVDLSGSNKSKSSNLSSNLGGGAGGGQSCGQCDRKFANTKQLKHHIDSYCHECQLDCVHPANYFAHQFTHTINIDKFPALSKALGGGGGGNGGGIGLGKASAADGFSNVMVAALPGLLSASMPGANVPVPPSLTVASALAPVSTSTSSNHFHKRHMYPKQSTTSFIGNQHHNSQSLDLSIGGGTTTSASSASGGDASSSFLTDMKPDLADIQSIISMAKHAKLPPSLTTSNSSAANIAAVKGESYDSALSLSPNRASDAGIDSRKVIRHGDATNHQPDSPASADSAAAAVVASASHLNHNNSSNSTSNNNNNSQLATTSLTATATLDDSDNHDAHRNLHHHQTAKSSLGDNNNEDEHNNNGDKKNMSMMDESFDDDDDEGEEFDVGEEDDIALSATQKRPHVSSASASHKKKSKKNYHHEIDADDEHGGNDDQLSKSSSSNNVGGSAHNGGNSNNSPTQRFRCEQCRLSFKSMNAFRRHNRGHTAGGGHSHACHLCPYKSLDKSTLIRHLRTHNGERPFQCSICKYAFTTKANCERHVRKRHRNLKSKSEIRNAMQYNRDMAATAAATKLVSEKIFIERDELPTSQDTVCKQCGVDFTTNRELRAHLRVPNNPCSQQLKPFVCTICKIGFNTRNNCVRHIIKQHPATIEVTDEDAAKVVAAVTANGAGETAESLMMIVESGGSNASLSPNSLNGAQSGHSALFSDDRSFSGSDHGAMSECDSYGSPYDVTDEGAAKSSPLLSPAGSGASSFAALCQVAAAAGSSEKASSSSKSPKNEQQQSSKHTKSANRSESSVSVPFHPLNLSVALKSDSDPEDVLDLSARTKRSSGHHAQSHQRRSLTSPPSSHTIGGLDLSVKPTHAGGQSSSSSLLSTLPASMSLTQNNSGNNVVNHMQHQSGAKLLNAKGNSNVSAATLGFPIKPEYMNIHSRFEMDSITSAQAAAAASRTLSGKAENMNPRSHLEMDSIASAQAAAAALILPIKPESMHPHSRFDIESIASAQAAAAAAAAASASRQNQMSTNNNTASNLLALYKEDAFVNEMNAMAAAFAKSYHPTINNEALASLMAQFHQHQQQAAQFALKAPQISKNH